ncbi:MAG: SRPBCC family protein, partial [Actinobacteria bacterium]|nr:SRPBCC family protein [Actinomycetota bacterium]MBW3650479.1 SRPBCC family protein [Actinomycetota bacterium]
MAVTSMPVAGTPEEVFALLADPYTYEDWVVGCDDIRAVEGEWPEPGSLFHHTVGVGLVKVKDNTKVVEVEPDRRLVLEARARPAGIVKVIFTLEPEGDGTKVTIEEYPVRGVARTIHNPGQDFLIRLRNAETLRRLDQQVRERREAQGPSGPPEREAQG